MISETEKSKMRKSISKSDIRKVSTQHSSNAVYSMNKLCDNISITDCIVGKL